MKQPVDCYGLHKEENGYWWLMQKHENISPIALPSSDCPFEIRNAKMVCPHTFDMRVKPTDETNDRLLRAKAKSKILQRIWTVPNPALADNRCVYIISKRVDDVFTLNSLLHLAAPAPGSVGCHWQDASGSANFLPDQIRRKLGNSNLSRYMIYGYEPQHSDKAMKHLQLTMNSKGRLFLVGQQVPMFGIDRYMEVLPFEESLRDLVMKIGNVENIRAIGARGLLEYMRS